MYRHTDVSVNVSVRIADAYTIDHRSGGNTSLHQESLNQTVFSTKAHTERSVDVFLKFQSDKQGV